jgi:hypothetical protein
MRSQQICILITAWLVAFFSAGAPRLLRAEEGDPRVPIEARSALSAKEAVELVAYHNKARRDVGVAPVRWSPVLATIAQQWADELARTDDHNNSGRRAPCPRLLSQRRAHAVGPEVQEFAHRVELHR